MLKRACKEALKKVALCVKLVSKSDAPERGSSPGAGVAEWLLLSDSHVECLRIRDSEVRRVCVCWWSEVFLGEAHVGALNTGRRRTRADGEHVPTGHERRQRPARCRRKKGSRDSLFLFLVF